MDIVELMAKNQYDRLHESERDYCLSERTIDKRNAEIMVFPKVHGSRVLGSLLEENPHKRKPPLSGNARNGVITAGDNVGPTKQNPANCFSQINRNHFNLGELEGNPACMGFNTFSQRQEKLSGGVQFSASSPIRNSCTMNCKWKGENVVHRSSQTNMPVLELCNTCRYGSQQNEEAEHVRSSMIPNHSLFGLKIPQKCATQSSNVEMISECPVTLQKRKMIEDLDMNFLNLSATKLEMQNRNFDSESIKRMSAKQPFICKHGGIELKTDGMGSLDLYPNETIPAMQLLSLMDAGVQSSTPFSLDGKPMFFGKPFFPCEHHPNVGLDTKSKFLEKPSLPCDHHSKEFSVIGTGVYKASDSSRYPSSAFCGRVSSKFQEEDTAKISYSAIKNRGRRSQKSVCIRGVAAGKSSTSNPVQDKKNGFLGAPDSAVSPLQCHRIEDSTKQRGLEAHSVNEIVWSMKNTSKTDICSVNRNPADFSIPEAGNVYMISGSQMPVPEVLQNNYYLPLQVKFPWSHDPRKRRKFYRGVDNYAAFGLLLLLKVLLDVCSIPGREGVEKIAN
ncbi:hypothetical protein F0562_007135 [Nyssa sinensis]|uniref:Uncharacterized protein n=1 Tax=Nyssa sinensis TaxID=561372 RepID=A0A5J5A499_9ASTE|nr:hypothetical protein F0562_007135 [Nyssa sinensis]